MKFGVSAFAWTAAIHDSHASIFEVARGAGFAVLEIPMFDPRDLSIEKLRLAFRDSGLDCTVCCILPQSMNPISPDGSVRKRSQEHLVRCVETAAELGALVLGGPMYAPIGYLPDHRPTPDERQWAVEAFQPLGDLLDEANITLAIEPVNRSETFFIRTAAEAIALVEAIGHPRIGVTLDTFHANIEEKSIPAAIDRLGPHLRHVHASENDRGLLGSGHVDFPGINSALVRNGYDGYVVIEGFGYSPDETNSPGKLWADMAVSPEDIARKGMSYLQTLSLQTLPRD